MHPTLERYLTEAAADAVTTHTLTVKPREFLGFDKSGRPEFSPLRCSIHRAETAEGAQDYQVVGNQLISDPGVDGPAPGQVHSRTNGFGFLLPGDGHEKRIALHLFL